MKALNDGAPAFDWAKDFLIHAALGAGILLVSVLLVFKDEGNKLGREKSRVRMYNNAMVVITENNPLEVHDFGATRGGHLGKFARAHCKEPGAN